MPFPHLNLVEVRHGPARLTGGGTANPRAQYNRENRPQHAANLLGEIGRISGRSKQAVAAREAQNLPPIPGGTPFLVQVSDGSVLEFLAAKLGLEVVAEYDDGFVVVAASDLDLTAFKDMVDAFTAETWGSGQTADVLDVFDDGTSRRRIEHVLSDSLLGRWPFAEADIFVLDVSIQTAGLAGTIATRPVNPHKNESPENFGARFAQWGAERDRMVEQWDARRMEREDALERLVRFYHGEFLSGFIDDAGQPTGPFVDFPDSFSARVKMSGKGFKDLVQNFPNLFEVTEPDDLPNADAAAGETPPERQFQLLPPTGDAPAVCVIDSGIQEAHVLLRTAIDNASSRSFLPDVADVADHVGPAGHGTRVAGAVLYPREIPAAGSSPATCWIQNARMLDDSCLIPARLYPPAILREIVAHFHGGAHQTRIFNHSVAANIPCRIRQRMSAWAAEIDLLSHEQGVLFIQAAGNIAGTSNVPGSPGVREHLQAGRAHPEYLFEPSSRIANPAQSLQALTVGSVALTTFADGSRQSLAAAEHPSAFSRAGFGMWDSIKPEVVELAGDYVRDGGNPPQLSCPPEVCPELVRSTLHAVGPGFARDAIGTSFAAPKVAHIAARIASMYPAQSSLLHRALVVHSARWPAWAENAPPTERLNILRTIGYGLPDIIRATDNTEHRVTLISNETYELGAGDAAIFSVPVPEEIRRPGLESIIRIDVTLSYSAQPRRTRRARTGYLSTWLDWISSRRGEREDEFRARAFVDAGERGDEEGAAILWQLASNRQHGVIRGVHRNGGTAQKDWAFLQSNEMPGTLCIAVRGHTGWASDTIDAKAKFALVVGFEAVAGDLPIYIPVRSEIEARAAIRARV
ncbi:MAG TPA: S8 family peptidase [Opitutaceae bacterium]|jgi:hypothetical protein